MNKVTIDEIIKQLDELLEANLEYTEETKCLRLFIRGKLTESLQHGIAPPSQEAVPPSQDVQALIAERQALLGALGSVYHTAKEAIQLCEESK